MPRKLILVGGPNGAGKTTFVRAYLKLYPYLYLSADALAEELSHEEPSLARIEAGRAFSRKVREALSAGESLVIGARYPASLPPQQGELLEDLQIPGGRVAPVL